MKIRENKERSLFSLPFQKIKNLENNEKEEKTNLSLVQL